MKLRSQHILLHLPHRIAWQVLDEDDLLGNFEIGDAGLESGDGGAGVECGLRFEDDDGADGFAEVGVGDAYDG